MEKKQKKKRKEEELELKKIKEEAEVWRFINKKRRKREWEQHIKRGMEKLFQKFTRRNKRRKDFK